MAAWRAPGLDAMLSDDILAENAGRFEAMVDHRFVRDIMADRLDDAVFRRYLVYEAGFVETAIAIFALAVAKAPSIAGRRWLIGVLEALANEQIGYFERSFAILGIDPAAVPGDPRVVAFNDGMRAIAERGSHAEIITAMFAAEWMYWTWCRAANTCKIGNPELRAWVGLHAAQDFADQALWLKRELDSLGEGADAACRRRLSQVFAEAMALEIDFHDAAYGP
ncbi:TenA family protein [Solirhodobacter olei]|uniref:TenA family protein n=1 Tax=Solirhodobacter olei TaxID=2493082 RepID=UPI001F4E80AA|nr:TenA family protein [Solirhodobacter olei]